MTMFPVSVLGACFGGGPATFFTVYRAAGALEKVLDGALLAMIKPGVFFQLGAIEFIAYGNDVSHGVPSGFNRFLKLRKYSIALIALSIGKGDGSRP